ncbi:O-succinylbenzoate synthase [Actinomadura craniellae]|uniref:O-succinylbenzoate synthase n=1 Tax=Actinomadura craniellae TaxID=2231787 RepID=A0A365GWM0_9ACTN|nr:enolase C-terminal domain-like protein [Actinomadura craniellae]RAY11168.1 O-succinylbenzoate synthase [Actinomadura craniellae]
MPRIQGCTAFRVAVPRGRRPESIVVRLTGDDGTAGWGEVGCPAEAGRPEPWSDIEERLAPALLGLAWDRPEDVSAVTELGTRQAAAAVDTACWDLWCKIKGMPLAHALGGTRTSIATGTQVTAELPETLVEQVNRQIGGGHTRVTVRVRPGSDIEPIRAVRHAYPALALVADCGGAYTESSGDLAALEALDAYGLLAIAHPFDATDLAAHARLQRRIGTPLCLAAGDLDTLDAAISLEAGRALNLRIDLSGGLTAARAAHDRAYAAGWDVWCSGSGGLGIGQAATVALASMPGCTLPSDVSDPAGGPAFVSPPVRSSGGVVAVPLTQPGLGHDIDEALLARLAARTLRVPAG